MHSDDIETDIIDTKNIFFRHDINSEHSSWKSWEKRDYWYFSCEICERHDVQGVFSGAYGEKSQNS